MLRIAVLALIISLIPLAFGKNDGNRPLTLVKLGLNDACAHGGTCCYEEGSVCVFNQQSFPNHYYVELDGCR